jgi:predicted nuclease of predicted toxin-antitoxin system
VNLLADESVDRQIIDQLRKDGHAVWYVTEMKPGLTDDEVLQKANQETAILLTADRDFGELIFRLNRLTFGVILIRLAGISPLKKVAFVSSAIKKHSSEFQSAFSVITPNAVRIRQINQH